MSVSSWIQRHPLLAFVCIAFGWTWSWDTIFFALGLWGTIPITIPRVWGPAMAAFVVIWASEIPLLGWIRRRLDWRVAPAFFLLAVLIPLFITNIEPVIEALGGGSLRYDPPAEINVAVAFTITLAANTFILGGTEELGWRGVLQPRLQQQMSVFTAGLVIGVMWWAWHVPLFFTGGIGEGPGA